jgi:hypothetical protein
MPGEKPANMEITIVPDGKGGYQYVLRGNALDVAYRNVNEATEEVVSEIVGSSRGFQDITSPDGKVTLRFNANVMRIKARKPKPGGKGIVRVIMRDGKPVTT